MIAADFFCGTGSWAKALKAEGFTVRGIDNAPQKAFPTDCEFILADVRDLDPADFYDLDVACFGPPCQGFSMVNPQVHRKERPNPLDMELARWPKKFMESMPESRRPRRWLVENVMGARPYFEEIYGPRALRYGAFWLWGNLPPFLVERSNAPMKFGGNRWNTGGRTQKVPYKLPHLTSRIPVELTRPFAQACANLEVPDGS
jgi:hypothetical protein